LLNADRLFWEVFVQQEMVSDPFKFMMKKIYRLLRNRDFLLILSILLGLLWGQGAQWTQKIVIPALAAVMTLSTMGVSGDTFRSPRALLGPALAGLGMNYAVLGGVLLGLSALLVHEEPIWAGFILMVAVPPAIAVIPFSFLLDGDSTFSLIATIGCYLGALIIMPLITLGFLGAGFVDRVKLITIMGELILAPLIFSRIFVRSGMSVRIEPVKGAITNWSFFLVTYTIVGLNRGIFLNEPLSLLPAAIIALASTFFLGYVIEGMGRIFRVDPKKITSLVLLGTLKNTGLAAGLALTLFNKKTAVPATVNAIFMIVYIIWLSFKRRWHRGIKETFSSSS
jgi:BASS family bile acid:Na+ symporter